MTSSLMLLAAECGRLAAREWRCRLKPQYSAYRLTLTCKHLVATFTCSLIRVAGHGQPTQHDAGAGQHFLALVCLTSCWWWSAGALQVGLKHGLHGGDLGWGVLLVHAHQGGGRELRELDLGARAAILQHRLQGRTHGGCYIEV